MWINTDETSIDAKCRELRVLGKTYKSIAEHLGISIPKAWICANRGRHNTNCRDSTARYRQRGSVPLCDLKDRP